MYEQLMDEQYYFDWLCRDVPWCEWYIDYINNIPHFCAFGVEIEVSFGHAQSPTGGMYPMKDLVLVYFPDDTHEFNGNDAFYDAVGVVIDAVKQKITSCSIMDRALDSLDVVIN